LGIEGILLSRHKVYVPNYAKLKSAILKQMHNVPYAGHPGYQKIVLVVKSQHYCPRMKREIAYYIAKCLECQRVEGEHRHPVGLIQSLPIPQWKWEVVKMDFITGFPRMSKQHDAIMVVVDKLTKASDFIPMKVTHKETNVANIYMREVACLQGIPKTIVFERDPKFTAKFWKGLFKGFRTNMNFNRTYHPEFDGKTKRVKEVIEDMLRMYVMEKPSKLVG
jgi:hypothetical protein